MTKALTITESNIVASGDLAAERATIAAVVAGLQSPHTRRAYERDLLNFLTWYGDQGRPAFGKATVKAYFVHLQDNGAGPAGVNRALSAIRTLVREMADNGQMSQDNAAAIARIKGLKSETLPAGRNIGHGELYALLDSCKATRADIRDAGIISLLYATGMRRGELVALDLADFSADSGELRILHGKGNKSRIAPIENGARAALDDWLTIRGDWPGPLFCPVYQSGRLKRTRLTTQAIYHLLSKRAALAGLAAPITPHDFRRTVIGDLLDAGADIATIQKLVGHSNVTTTARYDRRGEQAKRRAVKMLHVPYKKRL